MRATNELVTLFWGKDGELTGVLYENSHREIYKIKRANKSELAQILETEAPDGK